MSFDQILFEPWGLGDALIAASSLRLHANRNRFALACNSRWHELIRLASLPEWPIELLAVDLPYTTRNRKNAFDLGLQAPQIPASKIERALSIRGDLRDIWAIKQLFPEASVSTGGWLPFAARRLAPLNWLYSSRCLAVRNRYESWQALLEIPRSLQAAQGTPNRSGPVLCHIGAQWKSRQYPYVKPLAELLRKQGHRVELVAGPNDPLPNEILEAEVTRPQARELIEQLKGARLVITNDSGPMHLASYAGTQVAAIARISDIREWLPPQALAIESTEMPHGYRPDPHYTSDIEVSGWPTAQAVFDQLNAQLSPLLNLGK